MKREIYMSNLPDLTSSYTRKKKYNVAPLSLQSKFIWLATLAPALHLYNEYDGIFLTKESLAKENALLFDCQWPSFLCQALNSHLPFVLCVHVCVCLHALKFSSLGTFVLLCTSYKK